MCGHDVTGTGLAGDFRQELIANVSCGVLDASRRLRRQIPIRDSQLKGDVQLLGEYCREAGISLEVMPALVLDGQTVSSSRIRGLIAAGQIDAATALLTHPYRIRGMVIHGAGRGAQIGFPTANIGAIDTLLPGPGVYAGRLELGQQWWPAAINVGPNPTFGEQTLKVEVHAIGYHGSLYGEAVEVDFLSRLRDIRSFEGVDALRAQLALDVEQARRIAAE